MMCQAKNKTLVELNSPLFLNRKQKAFDLAHHRWGFPGLGGCMLHRHLLLGPETLQRLVSDMATMCVLGFRKHEL